MNALIGQKTEQLQRFLEDGKRIPVTVLRVPKTSVIQLKTAEKDGYTAVQLGIGGGREKNINKPLAGHIKQSNAAAPLFLQEIRITDDSDLPQVGDSLQANEILEPGDIVWVTGTSKGKGFAGGVKRYGFRGGPKTHGQSDRHRAPGSIGSGTTPGRVYRGKKMAGNMGNDRVSVKNLLVVSVNPEDNTVMLAGLVPGFVGSYVTVVKMGTKKKFTPLLKNPAEQAKADAEAAKLEAEQAKTQEEAAKAQQTETAQPITEEPAQETVTETPTEAETAPDAETPAAEQTTEATDEKSIDEAQDKKEKANK